MANEVLKQYCTCFRCGDINGYSKRDLKIVTTESTGYDKEVTGGYDPDIKLIPYKLVYEQWLYRCPSCGFFNQVGGKVISKERIWKPRGF